MCNKLPVFRSLFDQYGYFSLTIVGLILRQHITTLFICVLVPIILFTMNSNQLKNIMSLHFKCRGLYYPRAENVKRFLVPDEKVPWNVSWPDYKPLDYTASHIIGQSWADPDIHDAEFKPKWNEIDDLVSRKSHHGIYQVEDNIPLNPVGRTGIIGRGCLGRWGPNHAADPIVTRWQRNEENEIVLSDDNKPILQFVSIQRKDSGEWAIPGGMVDPGEVVTTTLKREFLEEALSIEESEEESKDVKEKLVNDFFNNGVEVYKGYVDDPRNTDNAWMETVALNFHDDDGSSVGKFPLSAGDDAVNVKWTDISSSLQLYASHINFIHSVAERLGAHW